MLNVAIIGTGVGIRTHLPAFRALDQVTVTGISGSTPGRTADIAARLSLDKAYPSYRELCDDPVVELVCVTSPTPFHLDHVTFALGAGKHVLCEKPLAMTVAESEQLMDLAHSKRDQLAVVNHQLRFNPYLRTIRQLIRDGAIGRPYLCKMHQQGTAFSNRDMKWSWSFDGGQGGGVRLAMGSHLIDLASYFFSTEFASVTCGMDAVVGRRKDMTGSDRKVTGSGAVAIHACLANGVSVHLTATAAAHGKSRFDVSVYGDEGEIQFDLEAKLRIATQAKLGEEYEVSVPSVFDDERRNESSMFSGSFRYFAPVIRDAMVSSDFSLLTDAANFESSLGVQRVLDACLESFRTDKAVGLVLQRERRQPDLV